MSAPFSIYTNKPEEIAANKEYFMHIKLIEKEYIRNNLRDLKLHPEWSIKQKISNCKKHRALFDKDKRMCE